MTIPAGYFDGLSARRYPVILSIAGGIASVEGEGVSRQAPLSSLHIGAALGSTPRIIRFSDGAFCEVADHAAFNRLLLEQGIRETAVSQWETSWPWVAASVLVFLLVLFATYRYGIPMVAKAVAHQVPPAASQLLGREVLEWLDGGVLAPSALPQARQDAIAAQFRRLQAPATASSASYRVLFRKSDLLGPNALALPSGAIVVTDALVALAQDDREILGVLAHEAGHVDRRHGLRQMLQDSLIGLLVAWYVGDVSTIAAAALTALMEAKYSRDLEREADAYAAVMLRANDIDVRFLIDLLRRLEEKAGSGGGPDALRYLSSHPATSERLEQLQLSR